MRLMWVLAIPVFLITVNVSWMINEERLYNYGFDKYNISAATGIEKTHLVEVAAQIRQYFNDDLLEVLIVPFISDDTSMQGSLSVSVPVRGHERNIYNAKETAHMVDVKRLVRWIYFSVVLSGSFLVLVAFICVLRSSFANHVHNYSLGDRIAYIRRSMVIFAKWTLYGSSLTFACVIGVSIFALSGFDRLFLEFHQASFANDLWQLNPYEDYLIMMFPRGFWFDATVIVLLAILVESAILFILSCTCLISRRNSQHNKTLDRY